MPFEAAKAVAATFCYEVRYALTPVFGEDFPDLCVLPSDRNFGSFRIDSGIIRQCTQETQSWLSRTDARHTPASSLYSSPDPSVTEPYTPPQLTLRAPFRLKKLRSKAFKATDSESGYGTESEIDSDRLAFSPQVSPKTIVSEWAAVNMKPSSKESTAVEGLQMLSGSPIRHSTESSSQTAKRRLLDTDDDYAGDASTADEHDAPNSPQPLGKELRTTESRAAYWLIKLSMEDAKHRHKRVRRASIN